MSEVEYEPFILYDLQKLLQNLGIKCTIFPTSEYQSLDGKKRRMWRLLISSFYDIKRLGSHLSLNSKHKKQQVRILLNSNRREFYKINTYLEKMKELTRNKGSFTVVDLSKISIRSITHARKIINKTKKSKQIFLVEPPYQGFKKISYAKYKVSE